MAKLTVAELERMKIGESKRFKFARWSELNSARSLAYQKQYDLDCSFTIRTDFDSNSYTITKIARDARTR